MSSDLSFSAGSGFISFGPEAVAAFGVEPQPQALASPTFDFGSASTSDHNLDEHTDWFKSTSTSPVQQAFLQPSGLAQSAVRTSAPAPPTTASLAFLADAHLVNAPFGSTSAGHNSPSSGKVLYRTDVPPLLGVPVFPHPVPPPLPAGDRRLSTASASSSSQPRAPSVLSQQSTHSQPSQPPSPSEAGSTSVDGSDDYRPQVARYRQGKAKHRPKAKMFKCNGFGECQMVFTRSEHLARHVRKHTGERPFKCHCGRSFSRLDNVRQHAGTVHADQTERNAATMAELVRLHNELSQTTVQKQMNAGMVIKDPSEASQARAAKKRKTAAGKAAKGEGEGDNPEEDAKRKGRGKFSVERHPAQRARTASAHQQQQPSSSHSSPHSLVNKPTYLPYSPNGAYPGIQYDAQHHSPLHQHAQIPQPGPSYYTGTPPPASVHSHSHSSPLYASHQPGGAGPSSISPRRRVPTPLQTQTPGGTRYYGAPIAYGSQISPGTAAREQHYMQQQQQQLAQQHAQQYQQQQQHHQPGQTPPPDSPTTPGRVTLPSISQLLPSPFDRNQQQQSAAADQQAAYYAQEQAGPHSRTSSAAGYLAQSGTSYGGELQQQQQLAMHHHHQQYAPQGYAHPNNGSPEQGHSATFGESETVPPPNWQPSYSIPTPVSAISLPAHSAPSPYATQPPQIKGAFALQQGAYQPQVTQTPDYGYQYGVQPQQQHYNQQQVANGSPQRAQYAQGISRESSERSSIPWNGQSVPASAGNGAGAGGLMEMVVGGGGQGEMWAPQGAQRNAQFPLPPQAVSSA